MQRIKTIFFILAILPAYIFADLSIEQMNAMVSKIKSKRAGLDIKDDNSFVSPFVILKKEQNTTKAKFEQPKVKSVAFNLGAIINNKAFVNKSWVAKGDTMNGYKIVEVNDNSVVLKRDTHEVKLFLKKSKPIFTLKGSK